MNPDRWQQISRIFKSAISLDGEARAAYVQEKCGTDSDLREEVERLIESHQEAENQDFIGGLAVAKVADRFAGDEPPPALNKGQHFGAYLILEHVGTGGMGEVYMAHDSRLGRTVALKILAPDIAADIRRMQRFRQEAKVASSLNQPNILTIYEFGEVNNLTFLAAEFVDGQTLRDAARGKKIKLSEVLDISVQILAALDAAHEANIIHRDIKPENVMIRRRDHVVKVLDFGLAKVTEKRIGSLHSQADTITEFKTAPGLMMGTVNYMSPEQAQAKPVDARSDIWSTGVMLYEMLAGTQPFGGATTAHTIVEIIEKDPPPLAHAGAGDVPAELQRIVAKSIAKNADERYQTAKDMLIDLRNLKKRLELDAEIERSTSFGPAVTTEHARAAQTATSRAAWVAKRKRWLAVTLVAATVVAVVTGYYAFVAWRNTRNPSAVPLDSTVPPAIPARTLTYSITVQKFRDGKPYQDPFELPGEINFEADYQIRLSIRSAQPGYLYVLNEGPPAPDAATEYVIVFPSSTANNGVAFVGENQRVQIPEQSWLKFDKEQGVEKLWLVFAGAPVQKLEALKQYATVRTRGLITDPAQNASVKSFLDSFAGKQPTVEKSDTQTTLKTSQDVLVYAVRLEHH